MQDKARLADMSQVHARLAMCGADAELIALCQRCLEPVPADRFEDAQAVERVLSAHVAGIQERLARARLEQAEQKAHAASAEAQAEIMRRRRATVLIFSFLMMSATTVLLLYARWVNKANLMQAEANASRHEMASRAQRLLELCGNSMEKAKAANLSPELQEAELETARDRLARGHRISRR